MESKLSRYCNGIIEGGWLAAVVATPLFFNIHSSRVFEPDKLTLLRSLAVFMAAAWLIRFIDQQGWRSLGWLRWRSPNSIWRMPFVIPILLLALIYIISNIFSVTRSVSWAGSYQRLQGTYTTLSYIVIFALMIATIRKREQVSRIVTTAIITSIPIALYGVMQHFGPPPLDPLPWGGNVQSRVAGNMGNSIFLGAWIVMVVPLTLARIIDAFTNILNDEELAAADVIRSSIYIFTFAIQIIAIIWTFSRGPFLGLVASMFAFVLILLVTLRNAISEQRRIAGADIGRAVLLAGLGTLVPFFLATLVIDSVITSMQSFMLFMGIIFLLVLVIMVLAIARRGWRWLWLSWLVLAVFFGGFVLAFNLSRDASVTYAKTPVVNDITETLAEWSRLPDIGRFSTLLQSESGTGKVRVLIWEGTLDLIGIHDPLESPFGDPDPYNILRPIIGYGPESMYVAYNSFYPPELATVEARNASPDRSHNETFDALVITGGAGFLVWQLVYLSVFYYGFSWLGVVRSNRDRAVLIGLWILGAIIGAIGIVSWQGVAYLGVAIPFGTIAGLIAYLFYYAIFSRGGDEDEQVDPFGVDRLIMIGLVAAILAHYVEIHFGIAIAATRIYFFVYLALLFMVGYLLPRMKAKQALDEPEGKPRKKRRARRAPKTNEGWISSILASAFVMALIIGIMSYNYMVTSLPEIANLATTGVLPDAGAFFHHSFFVNPQNDFADSPFIYLLIMLTWILGSLVLLSELAKAGKIGLSPVSSALKPGRTDAAGAVFVGLLVASAIGRFLSQAAAPGLTRQMGNALVLFWAAFCLLAAVFLFLKHRHSRLVGGIVATIGLVFSLPVLAAGAPIHAFILAGACIAALYLLWDRAWSNFISPGLVMAFVSLIVGFTYAYLHAATLRTNFIRPASITADMPIIERRVIEVLQSIDVLSTFYVFVFFLLLAIGLALAWSKISQSDKMGSWGGLIATLILVPLAIVVISTTNLQVIHADILYKRGEPFDQQGGRSGNVESWDTAIAIYEKALEFAPGEDFYYLMLGRAYLERASRTSDIAEREELLNIAEIRLLDAQQINPLNTDHTANLARLNTRRADTVDELERESRLVIATDFYDKAIALSPQNAVIINEYARLNLALAKDCDRAIELYEHSADKDPYFDVTRFEMAQAYLDCSTDLPEEEKEAYYLAAAESARAGLDRNSGTPNGWLLLAQSQVMLGEMEDALVSLESAQDNSNQQLQPWRIDLIMSERFAAVNDIVRAIDLAENSIGNAPENMLQQLQDYLANLQSISEGAG